MLRHYVIEYSPPRLLLNWQIFQNRKFQFYDEVNNVMVRLFAYLTLQNVTLWDFQGFNYALYHFFEVLLIAKLWTEK